MLQKNALVKAKKAVESLMNLYCDIYEYSEVTEDSITRHKRQIVHSNVPCRISYATGLFNGKLKSGQEKNSDGVSLQGTTVKMFFFRCYNQIKDMRKKISKEYQRKLG